MNQKQTAFANKLIGNKIDPNYRKSPALDKEGTLDSSLQGKEWGRVPDGVKVVRTTCFSCNSACEALAFIDKKSGKLLKIEGDPASPITKGVLCAKGLAAKDLVENPERLKMPLKRTGDRGSGNWKEISWDEALDEIAAKLKPFQENNETEKVAFLEGTRRGWSRVFTRFANVFGAVNHGAAGWAQCLWPRLVDCKTTFGKNYTETSDFRSSNCILVWGSNPAATWPIFSADIMDARERGASLIVVDPVLSETASKADVWLQLRPGTDTALALTMINIIISKGWYDKEFTTNWTTGFDKLQKHVIEFDAKRGEEITGIPAHLIEDAAELYAKTEPACIHRCVALDMVHDSVQACRAVSILTAITGNIDIPGGNTLPSQRGDISMNSLSFIKYDELPEEKIPLRRGFESYPLLCDKLCPVPSAHMPTLWETIATKKPFPIKTALIFGSNAAVSYSNANRVIEALKALDFLVVADLFMTPTAELADIVLPASSWLERDNVISSFQTSAEYTIAQSRVARVGESLSDVEIIFKLARKLNLEKYFWDSPDEMYSELLKPTGLNLEEFKAQKRIFAPMKFRQYEKTGFNTPSGKIELYSSLLENANQDPLPVYTEPFESPLSTVELAKKYPYILTTGGRVSAFRHTENRRTALLKELCPGPRLTINPKTAEKLGILPNDEVVIETETGWATAFAALSQGIRFDTIQVIPGWDKSGNINRVIPWKEFSQGMGSVSMRGILCNIYKKDGEKK